MNKEEIAIKLNPANYRVLLKLYNTGAGLTANEIIENCKVAYGSNRIGDLRDKGINIISEYEPNPNPLSRFQIVRYFIHPDSRRLAYNSIKLFQSTNK